jgi:DNA-binding NarL/FixJ family response regulator
MAGGVGGSGGARFRVLIVDDHPILRNVVRMACEASSLLEVVGEAADGERALRAHAELLPDVVVLDLILPGVDGIEVARRIKAERPETRVLVLTGRTDGEAVLASMRAGADGFLVKTSGVRDIASAIERVARGERVFAPEQERRAIQELGRLVREARRRNEAASLVTPREREVLQLLARGLTMQQAARRLGISPRTVESHVSKIYRKLGAESRVQAISKAAGLGLIDLG